MLILAVVLIAVNGFPFSYSLQTLLWATLCGLCGGFPPHEKANNKINRKTCPPHCTAVKGSVFLESRSPSHGTLASPRCDRASPHVTPSKKFGMGLGRAEALGIASGNPLPWEKHIPPDPQLWICPTCSFLPRYPPFGEQLGPGGKKYSWVFSLPSAAYFFHSGCFLAIPTPAPDVKGY